MCAHDGREHRTSSCWHCRQEAAEEQAARPTMPLLWEGDNS